MIASILGTPFASHAAKDSAAEIVKDNTTFAVDLYRREGAKAGNLFFSPYSISTALAMTYAGARGQTEQEMARVLHFGLSQSDVPAAFASLAQRMEEIGKSKQVSLSVANSLWCQRSYPFNDAFLKVNRDSYHAEARLVDFAGSGEATRKEINTWIARQTQDKIQDLLQPGQLSGDTRLVLCNAIYFKGNWAAQFDPGRTMVAPFFTAPGQSVETPMMSRTLKLRSREYDDFHLFALPYTGNDLSMVIMLPKAVDGLAALEERLDAAKLQEWLTAADKAPEAEAMVFLPKFKLNCRLELAKELSAMGMPVAFGAGADFSGMTAARDLFISHVVHQAFVDVNEEGTEAAAATGVAMTKLIALRPLVLRTDHPFIFLIRENRTGSILFLGRVMDPTK
jgi:serpin B